MLETLITVVHVVVAVFMILVVLVQGGHQGGVGAAFGGGNTQGVFGASGATSFLGKLTYGAAGIFMITSISLTVLQGGRGKVGLSEKLKVEAESSAPAQPEAVTPAPVEAPKP
jgi:preprotein translocase subunit SecG